MLDRGQSARVAAPVVLSLTLCVVGSTFAQDDAYVKRERDLMTRTVVKVIDDESKHDVKMMPEPVFRYGDEPQKIGDSTIWVWKDGGRPVAIQKIEVNKYFRPPGWTYCFSSLSDQQIEVKWPNVRTPYRSQEGLTFREIPNAPAPGPKSRWAFQSRSMSRQFSASMRDGKKKQQLRLLPNPILKYAYASDDYNVLAGSVYSIATGTNPSIYLLIELRETNGERNWFYGVSRATNASIRLNHKEVEVHSEPAHGRPGHFPTWTYTFIGAS